MMNNDDKVKGASVSHTVSHWPIGSNMQNAWLL